MSSLEKFIEEKNGVVYFKNINEPVFFDEKQYDLETLQEKLNQRGALNSFEDLITTKSGIKLKDIILFNSNKETYSLYTTQIDSNKIINTKDIIINNAILEDSYQKNYESHNGRAGTSLILSDNLDMKVKVYNQILERNPNALDNVLKEYANVNTFTHPSFAKQDFELLQELIHNHSKRNKQAVKKTLIKIAATTSTFKSTEWQKNPIDVWLREADSILFEESNKLFLKNKKTAIVNGETLYIDDTESLKTTVYKQHVINNKVEWIKFDYDFNTGTPGYSKKDWNKQYEIIKESDKLPEGLKKVRAYFGKGDSLADVVTYNPSDNKVINEYDFKASMSRDSVRGGMSVPKFKELSDKTRFMFLNGAEVNEISVQHLKNVQDITNKIHSELLTNNKVSIPDIEKMVRLRYNDLNFNKKLDKKFILSNSDIEEIKKGKESKYYNKAQQRYPNATKVKVFNDKKYVKSASLDSNIWYPHNSTTALTDYTNPVVDEKLINILNSDSVPSVSKTYGREGFRRCVQDDKGRAAHCKSVVTQI